MGKRAKAGFYSQIVVCKLQWSESYYRNQTTS